MYTAERRHPRTYAVRDQAIRDPHAAVRRACTSLAPAALILLLGLGALLGSVAYAADLFGFRGRLPGRPGAPEGGGTAPISLAAAVPNAVPPAAAQVGSQAPEIGIADLEGRRVTLDSLRGRIVLVNFWASWCPPCEKEMADLQTLYAEESGRGFMVLGVNEGEEPERAAAFMKKKGITFPTVLDADMDVTRRYQVFGLPNSFLIDQDGIVRARVVGPFSLEQMRGHLAEVRRGANVAAPRAVSVFAAMAAQNDSPAAEVNRATITLGEVNRRLDLETALTALRGGLAPDLTRVENADVLRRQQRALAERLVDERVVGAKAAAVGMVIAEAELEADLARVAEEVNLPLERLGAELAANGADIAALRDAERAMRLIGRYTAERILTGQNEERIDDFEQWFAAARRAAGARVLLPDG
ncbi:MAG: redoxin domain-containing protein [Chloroflexi bacterium]|nr:redoxin domain-containing protein [Chloroflexota bacterium]